ncbi:MAG: YIP1 family protein [Candidatus Thioglobus sp.]|nr:YIP1 family protein [Candidatus Thioglobus sp.]
MTQNIIQRLAKSNYSSPQLFFGYIFWIGLIPPVSAFFGTYLYGWPLGVVEPVRLSLAQAAAVSIFYELALMAGFISTAIVIKWMASVYAPKATLKDAFMVIAVAGTPIMIGGVAHIYPSILFHVLALSPIFAWSGYLFFISIPIFLKTNQDRGIFMGCAVLGYLVTAFLSLLGLSAIAWVNGIGPNLGV